MTIGSNIVETSTVTRPTPDAPCPIDFKPAPNRMFGQQYTVSSSDCGAFLSSDSSCLWRIWAPVAHEVELVLFNDQGRRTTHCLIGNSHGYFAEEIAGIMEGQRYAYVMDSKLERPDPASRWQPDGVHGPSAVWSPHGISWSDTDWHGTRREDLVIYELHVGTFTPKGTFSAIIERLEQLRDLGITAIELMPVAQFPGRTGWDYDGTYWYAVQHSYGGPRELQQLVDACHRVGMSVLLDVVYDHLGPEGNYLGDIGPYFKSSVQTLWGDAVNYDEPGSSGVRAFVLNNVRQWVRDFHIDGLRLDATHAIHDSGFSHIIADIKAVAEEEATRLRKQCHVIAESNLNEAGPLFDSVGTGCGLDALWNDDFHHCVHTLLTSERGGYYQDFQQPLPKLEKVLSSVFAYDGIYSQHRRHTYGAPVGDVTGDHFVVSIQNHDQVGNRALGERLSQLVQFNGLRLGAALMLLSPYVPMLLMGEEYGESNPFPVFCDFSDLMLRNNVRAGRRREFAEFHWAASEPDLFDGFTFASAKLTWEWRSSDKKDGLRLLYRDLLKARREWPALRDFKHREAQLINAARGEVLLKIVRGDPQRPHEQIEAYFNPHQTTVILPEMSGPINQILLSTEDLKYGGWKRSGRLGWDLSPFECIVVGKQQPPA